MSYLTTLFLYSRTERRLLFGICIKFDYFSALHHCQVPQFLQYMTFLCVFMYVSARLSHTLHGFQKLVANVPSRGSWRTESSCSGGERRVKSRARGEGGGVGWQDAHTCTHRGTHLPLTRTAIHLSCREKASWHTTHRIFSFFYRSNICLINKKNQCGS